MAGDRRRNVGLRRDLEDPQSHFGCNRPTHGPRMAEQGLRDVQPAGFCLDLVSDRRATMKLGNPGNAGEKCSAKSRGTAFRQNELQSTGFEPVHDFLSQAGQFCFSGHGWMDIGSVYSQAVSGPVPRPLIASRVKLVGALQNVCSARHKLNRPIGQGTRPGSSSVWEVCEPWKY